MIFRLGVRDNETEIGRHTGYWDIAQSLKNTPMPHPLPHPPLAQIHYSIEYLDKSFTFCLDLILLLLSFLYLYLFPKSLFCILFLWSVFLISSCHLLFVSMFNIYSIVS